MSWWKQRPLWQKVALGIGALIVVIGAIGGGEPAEVEAADPTTTTSSASTTTTTTPPTTTTTEAPTTTTPPDPKPEDFEIELVVIEDRCFNSAGALVTVRPTLTYTGTGQVIGDWLLVYEVSGVEAGKETYNMSVSGREYTTSELTLSTASCNHDLAALVTNVLPD